VKLLIIPSPDTTSLNIMIRCMSIAAEAAKRGHSVMVLAPEQLAHRFSSIAVQFREYPAPPLIDRVHLEMPPIKKYGDYATLIGLNDPYFIDSCLDIEAQAIADFDPDVIYSDLSLTASISSRRSGILLASLCNLAWTPPYLLDDQFELDGAQIAPFNHVLSRLSLPRIKDLTDLIFQCSDLKIVPSCPDFEEFHPSIEDIFYCGYLYSEALESKEVPTVNAGRKRVLVYMGVGDIDPPLMAKVLPAAFDGSEYQLTVVLGDFYKDRPADTANVSYVEFLPLSKALAGADLALFHGGSGMVMTCLRAGVPGLMFPCGVYEREFHAETMAKVNAGRVLYDLSDFTAENLRKNCDEILAGDYAANGARFGGYLESLGGPNAALEALIQLSQHHSRMEQAV
jgi:UDP:flavonoid glycosyltransferase YjiC (YdhE family)